MHSMGSIRSIRSSFALVATLAGATLGGNALAQDQGTLAQQRFLRGLAAFDSRQFAVALDEFRGSYALRASPNSRLYIARARFASCSSCPKRSPSTRRACKRRESTRTPTRAIARRSARQSKSSAPS
jgi:hypothetical protein